MPWTTYREARTLAEALSPYWPGRIVELDREPGPGDPAWRMRIGDVPIGGLVRDHDGRWIAVNLDGSPRVTVIGADRDWTIQEFVRQLDVALPPGLRVANSYTANHGPVPCAGLTTRKQENNAMSPRKYLAAIFAALITMTALAVTPGATARPDDRRATIGSEDVFDNSLRGIDIEDGDRGVRGVDVRNESLTDDDILDGSVREAELGLNVQDKLNTDRGVDALESDGPYPGATDLGDLEGQGDNSDELVPNDGGIHTVWVQCAPGKVALGGGFTLAADAGASAAAAVHVTESVPTQVENETIVYQPIEGDLAGSFVPNGWAVSVINTGTGPVIVRPHVVCADIG